MPFVGCDIGGTYSDTSKSSDWRTDRWVLIRWYELGSFYPNARIYSKQEQIFKEPT